MIIGRVIMTAKGLTVSFIGHGKMKIPTPSENHVVRIVQYKGAIVGSAVAVYYQGIVLTSRSSNK